MSEDRVDVADKTQHEKLVAEVKDEQSAATTERTRLMVKLLSRRAKMAADYKNTIKHTGGLLTNSMVYAYSKGLEDAFKLLQKDESDVKVIESQTEAR